MNKKSECKYINSGFYKVDFLELKQQTNNPGSNQVVFSLTYELFSS